jgi:hypothetical protein
MLAMLSACDPINASCKGERDSGMGVPPTRKPVRVPFCAVFTFDADDKIKGEIVYYDRLSLLSQLGVIGQGVA